MKNRLAVIFMLVLLVGASFAQQPTSSSWTINATNDYRIVAGITYSTANNYDCKLDVYAQRGSSTPLPTVVYFHGGGWVGGTKEGSLMGILPYLEKGLHVINVEYRLAKVSPAPAAVQDCRLALRWVFKNAKEYGFDTTQIILTGGSAGGHLALITGMLDASAGLDLPTDWDYSGVIPRASVVVNWFGITDVNDLLEGKNEQRYAVYWLANQKDKEAIARSVSPLTYVRKGIPPILTIHGDMDPLVPYSQAVRLHASLDQNDVPNKLITIPGGRHGGFTKEQMGMIWDSIWKFLKQQRILD
jgi:acetyl esterase/lipase